MRMVEKISKEEIGYLAQEIFDFHKANLAIIGPFKDEARFFKLLK